jgi:hypothetical protein
MCSAVCRVRLCEVTERSGANHDSVALDEREIRCDDDVCRGETFADICGGRFAEQPGKDGA